MVVVFLAPTFRKVKGGRFPGEAVGMVGGKSRTGETGGGEGKCSELGYSHVYCFCFDVTVLFIFDAIILT